jgi:ribosomal-protein-alanine N-acetyltransferase
MIEETFLEGTVINLRPLKAEDVDGNYANWLNDSSVTQYNSHGRFPMTTENLMIYVTSASQSKTDLILAIISKESKEHIGNISLQNINWVDRSAEIAFILGNKKFWGKGIMEEAGNLMMRHGFKSLNLWRIHCGTSSANIGMQKLAVKLKMQKEGLRRDAIFNQGQYFDVIEYGILSSEYEIL